MKTAFDLEAYNAACMSATWAFIRKFPGCERDIFPDRLPEPDELIPVVLRHAHFFEAEAGFDAKGLETLDALWSDTLKNADDSIHHVFQRYFAAAEMTRERLAPQRTLTQQLAKMAQDISPIDSPEAGSRAALIDGSWRGYKDQGGEL